MIEQLQPSGGTENVFLINSVIPAASLTICSLPFVPTATDSNRREVHRMVKMTAQPGRSERRPEAYVVRYVESPSEARTKLAVIFTILLWHLGTSRPHQLAVKNAPAFPRLSQPDRKSGTGSIRSIIFDIDQRLLAAERIGHP